MKHNKATPINSLSSEDLKINSCCKDKTRAVKITLIVGSLYHRYKTIKKYCIGATV